MLVRLFTGSSWSAADALGDAEFDTLPAIGHQVAIASGGEWRVGAVRGVVHRLVEGQGAADVALLLGPLSSGPFAREPLPLALLDGAAPAPPKAGTGVPRAGPWGG